MQPVHLWLSSMFIKRLTIFFGLSVNEVGNSPFSLGSIAHQAHLKVKIQETTSN